MTNQPDAPRIDLPSVPWLRAAPSNGHPVNRQPLSFDVAQASYPSEELAMGAGNAVVKAARKVSLRGVLITLAALLLAALATAEGIVSWHGQYGFIFAIKHEQIPAALEALGPDCGAVIFALLGVALALLGRRAITERVLVCACSALSIVMNLGAADLGSPRAIGAYVMPPVLFAVTSDRLIATIRLTAIGRDDSRSAWRSMARGLLWTLRLVLAPVSTVRGARQALLNATPLPALPVGEPRMALPTPPDLDPRKRGRRHGPSKTSKFLDLVVADHGPLAAFPVDRVSQVSKELAARVGLDWGAARTALRSAVLAAQNGDHQS